MTTSTSSETASTVAGTPPTVTVRPSANPDPSTATTLPPVLGPVEGRTRSIFGAGT